MGRDQLERAWCRTTHDEFSKESSVRGLRLLFVDGVVEGALAMEERSGELRVRKSHWS
jgi:hypothetical protein